MSIPSSSEIRRITANALLLLTLVKVIGTVFVTPLMGYANNYDFLRQSSCVGIWQDYSSVSLEKTAAFPSAPVNSLVYDGDIIDRLCMASIDNLSLRAVAFFHKAGDRIDFREIAFVRILALLIVLTGLFQATRNRGDPRAIALSFFLVFSDWATLLYANTFYLEFSAISSLYLALMSTVYLVTAKTRNLPLMGIALISLLWLAFSKLQYMPIATLLGLLCGLTVAFKPRGRLLSTTFFLMALISPFFYGVFNVSSEHTRNVHFANKTDTFLGAVLPEARDPESALSILGLPRHCLLGIGLNWYTPDLQSHHPCPEIENLGRHRLILLFLNDPNTFFIPLRKVSQEIPPFYPFYLGNIEGSENANTLRYQVLKNSSFSSLLARWPKDRMDVLVMISAIFSLFPLAYRLLSRRQQPLSEASWMVVLGGVTVLYTLASTVFGDGYTEVQKHAVGFETGLSVQVAGLILILMSQRSDIPLRRETVAGGIMRR